MKLNVTSFIGRQNPLYNVNLTDPLLSHVITTVRGGASLHRSMRLTWIIAGLVWIAMLAPLFLWLAFATSGYTTYNTYRLEIALYYSAGAMGVAIVLFPLIDIVTIAFTMTSLRSDLARQIKFDLLRLSLISPAAYIQSRLHLAKTRAWRVFVILFAARLGAVSLIALVLLSWFIYNILDDGFYWSGLDWDFFYGVSVFLTFISIFLVMLLLEPFWRFHMLTHVAASIAVRVRRGLWSWVAVYGALVVIMILQGAFAAGVTWAGIGLYNVTEDILRWTTSSYNLRESIALGIGLLPAMAMPVIVWQLQKRLAAWRLRVAERYVFSAYGDDA